MQLNTLQRTTKRKTSARIGRGGKRGKTSGHGVKGQKSRAGHKIRPEIRDMMRRYPKLRGFGKNRGDTHVYRPETVALNLAALETSFNAGDTVSYATVVEKGLVTQRQITKRTIKILGTGNVTKKLTVTGIKTSPAAQAKIEAAGGTCSS